MRVLHVVASLDPRQGGVPRVAAGLARAQAHRGHEVDVLTGDPPGGVEVGREQGAGPRPRLLHAGALASWLGRAERDLARHVPGWPHEIDVVHVHGLWRPGLHAAMAAARRSGLPCLLSPHGMLEGAALAHKRVRKALLLALRGRSDLGPRSALHFASEPERRRSRAPRPGLPAHVIPIGVDARELAAGPEPGHFRARLGIGDEPLAVFLGRLHAAKGLDLLLRAFARRDLPAHARLALVGPADPPALARRLHDQARRLGIRDRVSFAGFVSGRERDAVLADADLLCLPSRHESFGCVVLEAAGLGTPALVSDRVGIADALVEARAGVAAPFEEAALAGALGALLGDPEQRRRLGATGREWVRSHFVWEALVPRFEAAYRAVMGAVMAPRAAPVACDGRARAPRGSGRGSRRSALRSSRT